MHARYPAIIRLPISIDGIFHAEYHDGMLHCMAMRLSPDSWRMWFYPCSAGGNHNTIGFCIPSVFLSRSGDTCCNAANPRIISSPWHHRKHFPSIFPSTMRNPDPMRPAIGAKSLRPILTAGLEFAKETCRQPFRGCSPRSCNRRLMDMS